MRKSFKRSVCVITLSVAGCGTVPLPENVKLAGDVINDVRYEYVGTVEFDKVKRCVALNVKNENVRLNSNQGFVGAYTKTYYNVNSGYTDFAPKTLVMLDELHRYIVVNGSTNYSTMLNMAIVRFRLQVQSKPTDSNVTIQNVMPKLLWQYINTTCV